MNRFDLSTEFGKELKRLSKKYKTLNDDLEKFQKVLAIRPTGVGKNFTIIHSSETLKIVKARMACRALRDRSLRVVYAYFEQERKIEFILERSGKTNLFIEIYFKGEKENEDRERIKDYICHIPKLDL